MGGASWTLNVQRTTLIECISELFYLQNLDLHYVTLQLHACPILLKWLQTGYTTFFIVSQPIDIVHNRAYPPSFL